MKYMGSKARIVKEILPLILKDRKPNQWFVDLFCGGCNVVQHVQGNRIANDKNEFLISMFQDLCLGKVFENNISKELYDKARTAYNTNNFELMVKSYIGWIGWMASYNGRFFDGGYSGHSVGNTKRDYISEQIRNTLAQIEQLKGVKFFSKNYDYFDFKEPCIIYCDIPYKGTKQYATSKDFNHDYFFDWCRIMKVKGHSIFISEYNAPKDFTCIWEKQITNSMNTVKTYKPTEKLFTL